MLQTSKGRKRKLSCYKSKQRKKEEKVKNKFFPQNYVRITYSSSSEDDEQLDVEEMSPKKIDSSDDIEESIFSSDPDLDGYDQGLEESGNDEINADACASKDKFVESCAKEFRESNILDKLFRKLQRVGLLNDFINFMCNLESSELPMDNIVFILMMDRVRFNNCANTVGMRYGEKSKMFWTIVYRLCKESGLKFFSGSKNWGQVVNKESEKSKYSPDNAKINFAVPDEKVLCAYKSGLPKVIPPGKIDKCMEMLQNKKDIILMADGKLVTKGLKTDFLGDVNCIQQCNFHRVSKFNKEVFSIQEFGLKFFSGSKNWGQVVNKESEKSKYSPDNAKINFSVPDEKVLCAYKSGLPKVIPPGKIDKCMEMLQNKKDIILMADGKLVTKGLKTDFLGDVNLFGHERNPNLQNLKEELKNKLDFISNTCKSFDKLSNSDKYQVLLELTGLCTEMNQRIRTYNVNQKMKLQSFLKRDNSLKNVDKAISACKTNMYTSAIWIKKALKCNLQ